MSAPKILIENQSALGRNVEQVTLDSNRVNIQSETNSRLANFIAISSRGLWIDCSQWLAYSAGFFSLVKLAVLSPLPVWGVLLGFGLPFVIFATIVINACQRRKSLQFDGFIRFSLLFIGGAIAVV